MCVAKQQEFDERHISVQISKWRHVCPGPTAHRSKSISVSTYSSSFIFSSGLAFRYFTNMLLFAQVAPIATALVLMLFTCYSPFLSSLFSTSHSIFFQTQLLMTLHYHLRKKLLKCARVKPLVSVVDILMYEMSQRLILTLSSKLVV